MRSKANPRSLVFTIGFSAGVGFGPLATATRSQCSVSH
jgi:hypothetical protein